MIIWLFNYIYIYIIYNNENTYFPSFTPTSSPKSFLSSQDGWATGGTHLQCGSIEGRWLYLMSSEHPSPGPISSLGHVLRGKKHGASTGVGCQIWLEDAELAQLVGACEGRVRRMYGPGIPAKYNFTKQRPSSEFRELPFPGVMIMVLPCQAIISKINICSQIPY